MKNKTSVLNITVLIGSLFLLFNYTIYFIKILFWHEGALTYVVSLLVIGFVISTLILHKKGVLQNLFKKFYPVVKTVYAVALVFYMLTFLLLFGFVALGNQNPPAQSLPQNSVVLTMGAKVRKDKTPGSNLRKRLNLTLEILNTRDDINVIVSGGQGSDEPISEGECMKTYLIQNGISEERIMVENNATNTVENVKNSLEFIKENQTVVFVSNSFHIPRIKYIAKKLNLKNCRYYGVPDQNLMVLYNTMVREYMSYLKLFIMGT
jgi:uncharacterized SAM-binding protein YcdF (DUF218 family)